MKKTIAAAVIAVTCLTAGSVLAYNGQRNGGGYNVYCPVSRVQMQQFDAATQAKVNTFLTENAGLRKQLAMKTAEYQAMMMNASPNSSQAAALAGEIFDLRYTLQTKAQAAGLASCLGGMGMGMGRGMGGGYYGQGMGRGMGMGMGMGMPVVPVPVEVIDDGQ
jgi:zinc resistance-associated protein